MTNERLQRLLLWLMTLGLIPVALSYGLMPEKTLSPLYGFSVDNINLRHITRAVMGLYLGQIVLWFLGATKPAFRKPAMIGLVVFTLGIAAGRMFSLLLDGVSHFLLIVYLILELLIGFFALYLLIQESKLEKSG